MAIVSSLFISEVKGEHKQVDLLNITLDGIVNDIHIGKSDKQVSLISSESLDRFLNLKGNITGFCEKKFAVNIQTKEIEIHKLNVGTKIKFGTAILEITKIGKHCHADLGCDYLSLKQDCPLLTDCVFLKVVQEGIIKTNDLIDVI